MNSIEDGIDVNAIETLRNSGVACGESYIAGEKTCRVGEPSVIPSQFKPGDTIAYYHDMGMELYAYRGESKQHSAVCEVVSSRRYEKGQTMRLDPSRMLTLTEAKNIDNENAYLSQLGSGALSDDDDLKATKTQAIDALVERTDLDRGDVNQFLATWAESSSDDHPLSLHTQQIASQLFNAKLSDWQKEKLKHFDFTSGDTSARTKFLEEMKNLTDESLDDYGIKEVTLYRGVRNRQGVHVGEEVNVEGNSIESWSSSIDCADNFAREYQGIILKATFPASRVLSTAMTGFGMQSEKEWTILNTAPTKAIVVKKVDER